MKSARTREATVALILTLYLCAALFLSGCYVPFGTCTENQLTCHTTLPAPGTYTIIYLDTQGREASATQDVSYATGVLSVCGCSRIESVTLNDSPANLVIDIEGSPDPVAVNLPLTYTIRVINQSSQTVTGVVLTDIVPSSVTVVSTSLPYSLGIDSDTIKFNLGTLGFFTSIKLEMVVLPRAPGLIRNTAFASADQFLSSDNTKSAFTLVNEPSADLALTIADVPDPVLFNDQLTYTITVTNSGPNTATGVALTDLLQSVETDTFDITPSQGMCTLSDMSINCDLGTLPSGASATVTIVGFPFVVGTIRNTARVILNETDANTANNSATELTTVTE